MQTRGATALVPIARMSTWEMVRTSSRAVLEGQSSAPGTSSGDTDHGEQVPSAPASDNDGGG